MENNYQRLLDFRVIIKFFVFVLLLAQPPEVFAQDFKTIGYLPYYRFSLVDQIDFEKITHLNIAFAHPDEAGHLDVFGMDITPVVAAGHAAGAEVFIALAGNADAWPDWEFWLAEENRSEFIHNMMLYLEEYDLQGIDVDLEWSYVNDDYSGFVLELRDSIDQYDYALSAALPGTFRYAEATDAALDAFDWVNMMVYDLTGPWAPENPGPHSPFSFAFNSIAYWNAQGVENERLTLGVPFYGYDFSNQNNVVSRTFGYMVDLDVANAELDQVGEIYYNGRPTIEDKTELALNFLSGIMIWELGQDSFDEYSLLNTIYETINIPSSTEENQFASLSIYPNPTINNVFIKFSEVFNGSLTISDLNGRQLAAQIVNNQNVASFDLSEFPKGIYVINLASNGYTISQKLVRG